MTDASSNNAALSPTQPITKISTQDDLINLGKEIKRLMQKKKQADEHLVELEARVYSLETEYFKETSNYGSLMFGLEGYLGLAPASGGQSGGIRRSTYREVKDSQRIFSNTSASSRRAVSLYNKYMSGNGTGGGRQDDDYDSEGGDDDEVVAATRGSAQKRSRTSTSSSQKASQASRKRK